MRLGQDPEARELDRAIGDLTMIAFYYLLSIGEHEEFKLGDITFFKKDKQGNLGCLPRDAAPNLIMTADGATMKLDNQQN